ncbi:MAG: glycosyltransferase [Oceanicaulis sp.]|nr:glycosyltransferase [Oceanicaulis sp.]
MLDLARGLLDRGHDVTAVWSPIRAETSFASALAALLGERAIKLDMKRAVGPSDWSSLRVLTKLVRETGPYDILHGHSSKAGALVRLLPRSLPGARIYTPHALRTMDPEISWPAALIYGSAERLLARRTDALIAVSAQEARHAAKSGLRPRRLETVVNGVDPVVAAERMRLHKAWNVAPDAVVAGFVGRFSPQKDPVRFAEAVSLARRRVPRLVGVMMGDGELREAVEAVGDRGGLRLIGWTDARPALPGLDLLVMTSRYEAMPYTLLEALAAGLPILATEVGGVEETVCDGENGRQLLESARSAEIAEALVELASDPALLARWGKASRARARHYTLAQMVIGTEAVYLRAIERRNDESGQEK